MRGNVTIVSAFLLPPALPLPIEQVGRGLIFERHALKFAPRLGTGCDGGLRTTQRLERAIGDILNVVLH